MNATHYTSMHRQLDINVNRPERALSALAGGLLLCSASHGRARIVKSALGSFLLYRAATGNCPVYSAMGKRMVGHAQNVNIRTSITVNRPRREVYAFWRNLENLPLFMKHLDSIVQIDDMES